MKRTLLNFILFIFLMIAPPAGNSFSQNLSEEALISYITIMPGDAVYSTFGHTAIRVYDPVNRIDYVFNYGTFDFNTDGFYLKFIQGKLDYVLSVSRFSTLVRAYKDAGRPIIEQKLDITLAEKEEIYLFLAKNYEPENRGYQYDFFYDNCSTRPRDILERVFGDRLTFSDVPHLERTFRQTLDPYMLDPNKRWVNLGMDVLLGSVTDFPATSRERMYLPLDLKRSLDGATVQRDSAVTNLISPVDTLFWYDEEVIESEADTPAVALWVLLILVAGFTFIQVKQNRHFMAGRIFDMLLFTLTGILGGLIVFLMFFSEHQTTYANYNLLVLWPTHFLLAFGLPWKSGKAPAGWLSIYSLLVSGMIVLFLVTSYFIPQEIPPALYALYLIMLIRAARSRFSN